MIFISMMELVAEDGHWALRDNSMIFGNVVIVSEDDIKKHRYHLIDDNRKEIPIGNIEDYIVYS